MKNKFPIIALVIIILILSYITIKQIKIYPVENTLVKTFANSGAELVSWEIYFRGKIIDDEYNSVEDLEYFAEEFTRHLGITEKKSFYNKGLPQNLIHIVDIEGNFNDSKAIISINLEKTYDKSIEKHIYVSITNNGNNFNIEETRKKVQTIFNEYGIIPKTNICIIGSFDGRLTNDELAEVCENILQSANARKVEEMKEPNILSISAYSSRIENFIQSAGKKVNVNLAIRYNSYEERTYIWLASPIIETEY